jgi:hypothetical protein
MKILVTKSLLISHGYILPPIEYIQILITKQPRDGCDCNGKKLGVERFPGNSQISGRVM